MKNPAQNLRSQTKSSGSAPSGGVRSQLGGLGRRFAGQIAREPFEIAKTAGGQLGAPYEKTGQARPTQETQPLPSGVTPAGVQQQQQKPPEPSPEEKKKDSRLEAFQKELEEMTRLQKKREEEMRARWQEPEEVKKKKDVEAKKAQHAPLVEPATKPKRGLFGGFMQRFGLGRKQRQVEIAKTPTN